MKRAASEHRVLVLKEEPEVGAVDSTTDLAMMKVTMFGTSQGDAKEMSNRMDSIIENAASPLRWTDGCT